MAANESDPPGRRRRLIPSRRLMIAICWILVLGWAAFTVIRVFGLERTWILDVAMPFTPYIALAAAVPVLLALVLRRWRALAIATLTAIALATLFVPRALGQPDPGPGPTLRVMSQNMKIGAADPATIVGLVTSERIDVLAVDEFTPQADDALASAGLATLLPFSATHPLPGAIGSAIYSRYPLTDAGYQSLAGGFGQEYATVTVPGALPLAFVAVHTRAPALAGEQADWARSIAEQPAATPHGVVRMLAGDFNATFDQKPLRTLLATGYVDVASQLGDGMEPTWPYDGRWIPPVPITIDHFFVDPRIGSVSFGTHVVKRTDHKAIYASVTLPKAG